MSAQGTKPFMAAEILQNLKAVHNVKHDLESFFYVMIYIFVKFDGPNGEMSEAKMPDFLDFWLTSNNLRQMGDAKKGMLKDSTLMFKMNYADHFSPYFRFLSKDMNRIRQLLGTGKVTHDKFIAILRDMVKNLPEEVLQVKKTTPAPKSKKRCRENPVYRPSGVIRGNFTNAKDFRVATDGGHGRRPKRRCTSAKGERVRTTGNDDQDDLEEANFWL